MQLTYEVPAGGRLAGQKALITGGTKGIGEAIVRRFAQEGCRIVLTGRNTEDGNRIADELTALGKDVAFHPADLGDFASIRDSIDWAAEQLGGLTCLVNNANPASYGDDPGGGLRGVENETIEHWEGFIREALTGAAFVPIHHALPHLVAAGGGSIVQISSISSLRAQPGVATYGSAKVAQNLFIANTAYEMASRNIRANAIACGVVDTPTTGPALGTKQRAHLDRVIPLGIGQPVDIANVAVMLASPEARYLTGQTIAVDGGWTSYVPGVRELADL